MNDAVVSGAPMTFSVGGTLSVLLVNGFESTITRDDRFVIFETALNPIRGSFFNVANGGRLAATNTNGDVLGTFSVHYGPNSTDSPTTVVLKDFDTTIIILPDPQNSPDSRAFFPSRNDKSGVIEVAAIVRNAPSGATYHWTRTDVDAMTIDSPGGLQTLVRGLKPGKHELDFTVRDSSGVPLASQKLQLSIPQFVTIDEDATAFDAVLAVIHLVDVKNNVIEEAKRVCDHLLRTSNVRTIWRIGPFSEALPAHLPVATHVTALTIRGEPPATNPDWYGRTYPVGGAIGAPVFNEPINIFPGAYDNFVLSSNEVDTETQGLVLQLESQTFTDPALAEFAIKVFGRLIGETIAHEIGAQSTRA